MKKSLQPFFNLIFAGVTCACGLPVFANSLDSSLSYAGSSKNCQVAVGPLYYSYHQNKSLTAVLSEEFKQTLQPLFDQHEQALVEAFANPQDPLYEEVMSLLMPYFYGSSDDRERLAIDHTFFINNKLLLYYAQGANAYEALEDWQKVTVLYLDSIVNPLSD